MSEIKVEVVPKTGVSGDLSARRLTENLMARIDELGESISEIATKLQGKLGEGLPAPAGMGVSEIGLTFSVDLEAEAGVIVTRVAGSAGFEVTVTWSRTPR